MNIHPSWNKAALLQLPAFTPLHPVLARVVTERFPTLPDYNALLTAQQPGIVVRSGHPLCFVPQEYGKLALEAQYEPRCYLKGEVPTRENNWHDLLNALVWLTFPKSKAAINARHYLDLTGSSGCAGMQHGSQRGAVRDTNTLFDESGVIVPYADATLAALLRGFQWKALFWQHRAAVQSSMGFYLFGHGLYEKMLSPYLGLTGQGLLLPVVPEFFAWPLDRRLTHLDQAVADYLSNPQHCRATHELTPVPLLGIPGWAAENECEAYYENTAYFRPGRQSRAQRIPLNTAPSSVAG